jgi:hypothetical protein
VEFSTYLRYDIITAVPFKKSLGFALKNKFVSFDRFLCYKHDDKELTANDKRCHFFKGVCVNRETGRPSSQVGYVLMSLFKCWKGKCYGAMDYARLLAEPRRRRN